MAYRVELTDRSESDLSDIYAEINASESIAAVRWFNGFEEAVYALSNLPRRCHVAPEAKPHDRPLRHLLYGNKPHIYRAIFEIDEENKVIYVLHIRHGARDEANLDELS